MHKNKVAALTVLSKARNKVKPLLEKYGYKPAKFLAKGGACEFLHATAGTAIARLSHRNSVRLSVCHMGGSVKNGAS